MSENYVNSSSANSLFPTWVTDTRSRLWDDMLQSDWLAEREKRKREEQERQKRADEVYRKYYSHPPMTNDHVTYIESHYRDGSLRLTADEHRRLKDLLREPVLEVRLDPFTIANDDELRESCRMHVAGIDHSQHLCPLCYEESSG